MLRNRTRRAISLSMVMVFMYMIMSPALVTAQVTIPGGQKAGPYVDKLVFKVITQDDQQVLALQNNEIDLIGDMVDPSFLPALEGDDHIDVAHVLRNGYGFVTIMSARMRRDNHKIARY